MSEIIKESFLSSLLEREIPYRVILPTNYAERSEQEYPILYLLHGLFGCCDNFLDLTRILQYVGGKDLIVIFPEGANGWYSDSQAIEKNKFESYFRAELFPLIDNRYRTIKNRRGRAIAGISMGGYGAFKIAFKHPLSFTFVASMSGAFDAAIRTEQDSITDWEVLGDSLKSVFGDQADARRKENNLFYLVEKLSSREVAELPDIYFDCGKNDSFLEINRRMAERLKSKNASFEFCEIEGEHNWDYWDARLAVVIDKATEKLCKARNIQKN